MSIQNSKEDDHIENAEEVIELFGGIRPMAKKIDVAVTTVQGWKKRGVIPAGRRESIMEAAEEYGVDLSGAIGKQANQNEKQEILQDRKPEEGNSEESESYLAEEPLRVSIAEAAEEEPSGLQDEPKPPLTTPGFDKTLEERLKKLERRAVSKAVTTNVIITIMLIGAALGAAYMILDPFAPQKAPSEVAELEGRVNGVQQELEGVKQEQRSLRDLIPDNFRERLGNLQQRTDNAQAAVGVAIERAERLSQNVLGENADSFEQRLSALEGTLKKFVGSAQMTELIARLSELQNSATGQVQLDRSVDELNAIVMSTEGDKTRFDSALDTARNQSAALSQTFEGVPSQDLKAAAMLLAFSQLRQSLNRSNEPFEDDLSLLMNFVGEDDLALKSSLQRLAPHANRGVLSPEGLSSEFRSLAGDAVVASLKGEDVSLQDKAKARFNEIFSVEKNDELITGTETQVQIDKTQDLLEKGNVEEAVAVAAQIDGPAADVIAPWLKKAQATLAAQQTESIIDRILKANLQGAAGQMLDAVPGGEFYMNPETGVKVYKPTNRAFKQLQLDQTR